MAKWPPPTYRFKTEFRFPLRFVFRWCTDYQPDDSDRSGEQYERRVLTRTRSRIVLEDLWWSGPDGWGWRRTEVSLHPPDRWHAVSYGSFRDAVIDYRLRPLGPDRTEFELTMRRRPHPAHPTQPSRRALEQELREMWTNFGRAMRRDYRGAQTKTA